MKRLALVMACALATGCQVASVRHGAGHTSVSTGASVSLSTEDRIARGLIVAIVVADALQYYTRGDDGRLVRIDPTPEFAPDRTISVQDCTQPINPELGNLVCR